MRASDKIDKWVMNTYMRNPITFVKGEGATLWDEDGKQYTDFLAGLTDPAEIARVTSRFNGSVLPCSLQSSRIQLPLERFGDCFCQRV